MSRYDFIGNFNLKVAAKSVDDVLKYVKSKVGNINSRVNVVYERVQVNRIEQDFKRVNKEIRKTGELTDDLASIFANATRRFAGVSIATATLLNLVRGVKGAYKEAIQFEREMIRVAQAQDATIESTKGLSKEVSRLSVAYGINALELAKTGRVLAQAGFNTKTTTKALEILAKINLAGTFGDAEENVEGMISILQQFGAEARASGTEAQFLEEKFNIINKISKKYAVESSDIITAVSKAGGSFETAGGSLEEFIASITAVRSATRESAATIANGFKTIFTRLQRAETIDSLRELGVELVDAEGKFVGPIKAMEKLGRTLSVLDKGDVRFTQIAEEIGGIYQVNRLITLLKQQDVVQRALNDTRNASGDIDKDVAKGLESTATKLDRLSASFNDLIKTISETESFRTIIDYMIKMADTAIMVAKALEPLTPLLLAAVGAQGLNLGAKISKKVLGFASNPKSVPTIATNNFNDGGKVRGPKGIDKVNAKLTDGEFVIKKDAVLGNESLLRAINRKEDISSFFKENDNIQGFADGGPVENISNDRLKNFFKKQKMPQTIYDDVKNYGVSVKRSESITNIDPALNYQTPRGQSGDFKDVKGLYRNKTKSIFLKNNAGPEVVSHELGHAYDYAHGGITDSKEYIEAYTKDLNKLSPKQRSDYQYYSQPGVGGRRESFAAIFDSTVRAKNDDLDSTFSESSSFVKKKIKDNEIQNLHNDYKQIIKMRNSGNPDYSKLIEKIKASKEKIGSSLVQDDPRVVKFLAQLNTAERLYSSKVQKFNTGGTVTGGSGGVDDIPAMLTRGEFVINRADAQKNRALLHAINSGKEVRYMAKGGSVGGRSNITSDFQDLIDATSSSIPTKRKRGYNKNFVDTLDQEIALDKKKKGISSNTSVNSIIESNRQPVRYNDNFVNTLDQEISAANSRKAKAAKARVPASAPEASFSNNISSDFRDVIGATSSSAPPTKNKPEVRYNPKFVETLDREISASTKATETKISKPNPERNFSNNVSSDFRDMITATESSIVKTPKSKTPKYNQNFVDTLDTEIALENQKRTSAIKSNSIAEQVKVGNAPVKYNEKFVQALDSSLSQSSKNRSLPPEEKSDAIRSGRSNIRSFGSTASEEQVDKSLNLYNDLIEKGIEPQKALNHAVNKLAKDLAKSPMVASGGSLEGKKNMFSPQFLGGEVPKVSTKSLGAVMPPGHPNPPVTTGSNNRKTSRDSNNPPNNPPGGPPNGPNGPNGPDQPNVSRDNKLTSILDGLAGKFLLIAGGAGLFAEYLGMLSKEMSIGAGSFAAGYASVKLGFSALSDITEGAVNNFKNLSTTLKTSDAAQKASTVSETAANIKSASSEMTKSVGGFGNKLSNVTEKLNAMSTGIAVAVGAYAAINALQVENIANLRKSNDEIIDRVRSGSSRVGDDKLLQKNIKELGDARGRNDAVATQVGGLGVAGAIAGGIVGSIVPGLGTAIGSIIGAIAGSGLGYAFNQLTGNTEEYIKSTKLSTEANYKAAKATASFDRVLKSLRSNNVSAANSSSVLDDEFKKASLEFQASQRNSLKVDELTSTSSGIIDTIGIGLGAFDAGAKTTNQKEIFEEAKKAEATQKELLARKAEARSANTKDLTVGGINKAANDDEINKVLATLDARAAKIKEDTIASSTETDLTKKNKEGDEAARLFVSNMTELAATRTQEVQRINASKAARDLELEAIKRTTDSMISLAEKNNNLDIANSLIDQITTGFSKGVSGSRFSDISKIGDIGAFEKDARSVASNLGSGGQEVADRVVTGAQFVSELRNKLTSKDAADFDKVRSSTLGKESTSEDIRRLLIGKTGSFSKLGKNEQDFAINTIQQKLGKDGFSIDTLQTSINEISGLFQLEADNLGKQADLTNNQIETIRRVNDQLQEAYTRNGELQIGLVDVQQNAQDRLNKVFDAVLTGADRNAILAREDQNRTKKSNISLNAAGVGNIAGNTGALGGVLRDAQARRSRNDRALEGESNMVNRSALNTENQKLDAAIKATTDELTKLANQSEKAAGIMAQIDREQSKRNFVANKAEAFITGSPQDRARAREQESAVNLAMMTGTLQNLPSDLRKSTLDEIKERAKLDDTGQTQKYLERILSNDARNPAERAALLNTPTTKEQQLINDLRALGADEAKAQKELINSQALNTKIMTDLLNKVNALLGQPKNTPQQPVGPGRPIPQQANAPVNPTINRGGPQFQGVPGQQVNAGMNTVADNITKMTAAISGMKVDHQVNINGQINVGGLNLKNIEMQLAKGLEGYIAQKVTETINNSKKGFKTG